MFKNENYFYVQVMFQTFQLIFSYEKTIHLLRRKKTSYVFFLT